MNAHDKGDVVRLSGTFRDIDGALVAPSAVTLKYRSPSGAVTTIAGGSLTNPSTGLYTYDLTVDAAGVWTYRYESTGTAAAQEEATFIVRSSRLTGGDP